MIEIVRKEDCVGCNACVQRCPKQCIVMAEDEQGFLYPKVDLDKCIDCHLCEIVCPVINQNEPLIPFQVFAAKNRNSEVRRNSSSGGVFYAIATQIINDGGVVFGARFNDKWDVIHDYAETLEGVKAFQGSKYVQSLIGDSFKKTEEFLKLGRKVMFTGTPCQIAGLRRFLRKDYGTQLLLVDVVCHGVPSPLVWRDYLQYITRPRGASDGKNTVFVSLNEKPVITGISFRDKRLGWEKFGFSVRGTATKGSGENSVFQSGKHNEKERELLFEPMTENIYMRGFLRDIYLRPSCYACPSKRGKSHSDITLADYWNIQACHPEIYDTEGVSLILVNSENGKQCVEKLDISLFKTTYNDALSGNPSIEHSVKRNAVSSYFWKQLDNYRLDAITMALKKMRVPLWRRILGAVIKRIRRLF